ncbi:SGNH/GDSL hydrolase family protein [Pareuzebyella sediminis]|uniref:SGNH/GDSL hydrolase family protein n=1 Tax=Pareuzebyella sediminis TaxID=2607998 RepID=UPI001E52E016|nr:SGNH/GDSL hydrolase family protein [Pareuzebyella sediminis]
MKRLKFPSIVALIIFSTVVFPTACSKKTLLPKASYGDVTANDQEKEKIETNTLTYLALGDSYTIGASVPLADNFPSQLRNTLTKDLNKDISLEIIATSGWRTDNLIDAIENTETDPPYTIVTLLIGVNNQYQGAPFSKYKSEFVELLEKALVLAGGNTEHLFVISIPDWAYTPFGQEFDADKTSKEIDQYNAYAKNMADQFDITFIDITDITRRGLEEKELVASDGLHPSVLAYTLFVERMAPIISYQLKN